MDKQSYARYLFQLMDEEIDSAESDIEEAHFMGIFKCICQTEKGWKRPFLRYIQMEMPIYRKFYCSSIPDRN